MCIGTLLTTARSLIGYEGDFSNCTSHGRVAVQTVIVFDCNAGRPNLFGYKHMHYNSCIIAVKKSEVKNDHIPGVWSSLCLGASKHGITHTHTIDVRNKILA